MKTRKVQVTLEEPAYQVLLRVAEREKKKLAAVVRESIVRYCVEPESAREKQASLAALFSIDAPVIDDYEAWEREYSRLKAGAETIATKPTARVEHAGVERPSSGGKRGAVPVAEAYFLDASVLMYAAGGEHPLRDPCRAALARCVQLGATLVLDAAVLQEILYRYFSIGRPDVARSVYEAAVQLADEVLPVEERHTARALELLLEHRASGLTPRDAIHVATAEARGLTNVLSNDRHFDSLPQVERVDPEAFSREHL